MFELYALSAMLDLSADATRAQLLDAMKDIIMASPRTSADSVNNPGLQRDETNPPSGGQVFA